MAVPIRWLTAFIDRPAQSFTAATDFWLAVTKSKLSPSRGRQEEFATFLPPDGDPYLRVQRIAHGTGASHVDLHVDSMQEAAALARQLGARVERSLHDVVVMRSPSGLAFCLVDHHGESVRPAAVLLEDSGQIIVDQLCIDVPPADYGRECDFWSALTGWEHRHGVRPEFSYLRRPPALALRLLLQRLDRSLNGGAATAHLDLACDDADAAAVALERAGARVVARHEHWITMTDPASVPFCLTRRDPQTGTLSA